MPRIAGERPSSACTANRGLLSGIARANHFADDDQSGCDPDASLERLGANRKIGDRPDDRQRGTNSLFGVRFVGSRPSKVDEHAITDIAGHEAADRPIVSVTRAW